MTNTIVRSLAVFCQEVFGGVVVIMLMLPLGPIFGDSGAGWIAHVVNVFLHAYISAGAGSNPCGIIVFTSPDESALVVLATLAGQIVAGLIAFPIMEQCLSRGLFLDLGCGQVSEGTPTSTAAAQEVALSCALMLLIYTINNCKLNATVALGLIAVGIRVLVACGGSMNPMFGIACWHHFDTKLKRTSPPEGIFGSALPRELLPYEYPLIYCIAPLLGAVLARSIIVVVQIISRKNSIVKRSSSKKKKE